MAKICVFSIFFPIFLIASCASIDSLAGKPTTPAMPDAYFATNGGGEPRSAGYWLLWNSCAPDNRAETAAANGGRAAGWFIMDDLLTDPGILMGERTVASCAEGVHLLGETSGDTESTSDAAGMLVAQLLTAQLNLAAGAEFCPAVNDAVQSAQLLLLSSGFDGSKLTVDPDAGANAQLLANQLATYNSGTLCR
jgi:hypothetical protein